MSDGKISSHCESCILDGCLEREQPFPFICVAFHRVPVWVLVEVQQALLAQEKGSQLVKYIISEHVCIVRE